MATYRIGIGSFNLKDGAVGIGTESTGLGNLKVEGTIKTTDLDVTGVSTFTRYSGFNADQFNINRDTTFDNKETVTYTVTVAGGIFYIDGVSAPRLELKRGSTYIFDQSGGTNANHPFRFKDRSGELYHDGVSVNGTPGSSGAFTQLKVNVNAPDTLRYYCTVHGNSMGNIISVVDSTFYSLQNIGDVVVGDDNILSVGSGSTSFTGEFDYVCVKHHFSVPTGDTAGRNKSSGYSEGTIRFNTDLKTMEFFNGDEWKQFTYISDIQNSPSSRGRGVIGAGYISSPSTVYYSDIQFFSLSSGGQAESFGDVLSSGGGRGGSSFSSSTRGLFATGRSEASGSSGHNTIEYVTIASAGDAIDFGDASEQCYNGSGCSSSTRGVFNLAFVGGSPVYNNVIEFVEMSTLGNSADFGDLTNVNSGWSASVSSSTRGFWGGFYPRTDGTIDMVNIASKGNATLFGGPGSLFTDYAAVACSNSIRGIYAGGTNYPNPGSGYTRLIQYITMSSDGNAINFGDLSQLSYSGIGVASQTRGCIVSGLSGTPDTNYITTIQDIFFSSGGTTNHFGDISIARRNLSGVSDSHGGLGGF